MFTKHLSYCYFMFGFLCCLYQPFYSNKTLRVDSLPSYLPDTLPLTQLGINQWKNFTGGLYPNGQNERPHIHDDKGMLIAKTIQGLDTTGNLDAINGKIVLLSIGMSNATQEFSVFKIMADSFRSKNPKLTIVDGAQGGQTASVIKDPKANFWTVVTQRLTQQKLTAQQVQVVWLKEANGNPTAAFPKHAQDLKNDLKLIVQILQQKFPNLKSVYLSSRIYGGYANTPLNPEPYAYESGFSVKWLIEEQLSGDTSLRFEGLDPRSAWLSWGPYLWAQGLNPRTDGLFWSPADFGTDGTHPSNAGRLKVATQLFNFFSTDSTTIPWFLKSTITNATNFNPITNSNIEWLNSAPNPCQNSTTISWKINSKTQTQLILLNSTGQAMEILVDKELNSGIHHCLLNTEPLHPGIYFAKINQKNDSKIFKIIKE